LCLLPSCFFQQAPKIQRGLVLKNKPQNYSPTIPTTEYPITIWVHGTRLAPPGVLETFFHSEPGLNHYSLVDSIYKQRRIAEDIISSDPDYFMTQGFYLFGWSGKLS